jgi:hypothetical protein
MMRVNNKKLGIEYSNAPAKLVKLQAMVREIPG